MIYRSENDPEIIIFPSTTRKDLLQVKSKNNQILNNENSNNSEESKQNSPKANQSKPKGISLRRPKSKAGMSKFGVNVYMQ